MLTLRLTALATALVFSLSGCAGLGTLNTTDPLESVDSAGGATATPTPEPSPESTVEPDASAPAADLKIGCESPTVTKAFKKSGIELFGGSKFDRDPIPGSARAIAADNGGMMCVWDIGGEYVSAWWTTVDSAAWNAAEKAITEDGGAITVIPGIDANVTYFAFHEKDKTVGPNSSWVVDALHGSTWIRLTSTSWVTPDEGVAAFAAALKIAKLRG